MKETKNTIIKEQWNCPEFFELDFKRTEDGLYSNRTEDFNGLDVDTSP